MKKAGPSAWSWTRGSRAPAPQVHGPLKDAVPRLGESEGGDEFTGAPRPDRNGVLFGEAQALGSRAWSLAPHADAPSPAPGYFGPEHMCFLLANILILLSSTLTFSIYRKLT